MRIGFFTNNYFPRQSGAAHAIENFRSELEKLGHDVFVFAPRYGKKDKTSVKLFRYKSFRLMKKLGPLSSIPFPHSSKIRKQIEGLKLDVIHSHHPYLLGKTALQYAGELGIPLIFSVHTPYYQFLTPLLGGMGELIDSFLLDIFLGYVKKCNLVTVPTQAFRDNLLKSASKIKIEILPSGINLEEFGDTGKAKARKMLGLDSEDIILLTIGRLSYERNISFLIEAFKDISEKYPRAKLVIVGSGLEKMSLKGLTKILGLKEKVIFTGRVPYKKLALYYSASDLFLYASLIDSQGLVLCEAMASGLPIVSTNQAMGPQSLVKNDQIGFLTPPNIKFFSKKVQTLIKNEKLRRRFGINAKKEAQHYDRRILAKKLEQIYQDLIQNND